MTDKINELMRLADEWADECGGCDCEHLAAESPRRAALKSALEAALKPGVEPVGYRYKFRNFMGDEVWSFELPRDGKVLEAVPVYNAPPAQTPVPHGWWIVQSTPEKLNMWPTSEGQLLRIAAPPTQTPPPRLTDDEICEADPLPHAMFDDERVDFARAIETAVRKHFGVNDE